MTTPLPLTIDPQKNPWLTQEVIKNLMDILTKNNGAARFVGGCVRDALLDLEVTDIDIATTHEPKDVKELLKKAGIKFLTVGEDHGCITAILEGKNIEITSLRKDVKTDGRHAEIAFSKDWKEDAERRDFTMNALYADIHGKVYDPLNQGLEDLAQRQVKFIGDAATRIQQDYLRILRFFRFTAKFSQKAPKEDTIKTCIKLQQGLEKISGERLWMELRKILQLTKAATAMGQLNETGILSLIFPVALKDFSALEKMCRLDETQLFRQPDPYQRLAVLLTHDSDIAVHEVAKKIAARFVWSQANHKRLTTMLEKTPRIFSYMSTREMRRALYYLDCEPFKDKVMLGWCHDSKENNAIQWRALLAVADSWQRPKFPLSGDMIRTAGVPEGPQIGRISKEVEEWWVDADFIEDEFSIIERLKAIVQATIY